MYFAVLGGSADAKIRSIKPAKTEEERNVRPAPSALVALYAAIRNPPMVANAVATSANCRILRAFRIAITTLDVGSVFRCEYFMRLPSF